MKIKIRNLFLFIVSVLFFSCNFSKTKNSDLREQVITVSILPQKTFVEKIAGDDFRVNLLLPTGASPASFTLLPSQLKDIARSEVWLRIGHIGFEYSWKEKIEQANIKMKVVDLSEGLDLIAGDQQETEKSKSASGINPHIWMSPKLVKQMSQRITDELSLLKPEKKATYESNYLKFCQEIDQLDTEIKNALDKYRGRVIILFHPSLSYYARDYGLVQQSLEPGGKEPTPQRMAEVIKMAKNEDIRVIYIQSDLDREQARVFAEEVNGEVIEMWPLNPDWAKNLMEITGMLIENF